MSKETKRPTLDLGDCIDCDVCLEVCPSVFRQNDAGYIEVVDLPEYPEEDIDECIKNCPAQCISWEDA
jgi:ferredoxin